MKRYTIRGKNLSVTPDEKGFWVESGAINEELIDFIEANGTKIMIKKKELLEFINGKET